MSISRIFCHGSFHQVKGELEEFDKGWRVTWTTLYSLFDGCALLWIKIWWSLVGVPPGFLEVMTNRESSKRVFPPHCFPPRNYWQQTTVDRHHIPVCVILQNDEVFRNRQKHKLVITGQDEVSVEVIPGSDVMPREDLSITHEEADNIIVQQAIQIAANEKRYVRVLAVRVRVHYYLHE